MNKNYNYIASLSLFLLIFLGSCSEADYSLEGEGALQMRVKLEDKITPVSRTLSDSQSLSDSAVVRIYSENGLIRKYKGLQNIPATLPLSSGMYKVNVVSGDSVPASFDKVYYKGSVPFTISAGKTSQVNVPCKIANTLVTVSYRDVESAFSDYFVKVYLPQDTLVFDSQSTGQIGYFMMPDSQTPLKWSFEGVQLNGQSYIKTGTIESPKATTKYALTFNFNESASDNGGALIEVEIDKTEIRVDEEVVIFKRPEILGENFDIASPVRFEVGKTGTVSVWIATSSLLKSAVISSESFSLAGVDPSSLELVDMQPDAEASLADKGITILNKHNEQTENTNFRISFTEAFISALTVNESSHAVLITATDSNDKTQTVTLNIMASDAIANTLAVKPQDVWSSKAIVYAEIVKETMDALTFQYRQKNSTDWISVDATRSGNMMSATLSALQDATEYEFRAVAGTSASSMIHSFITDENTQLPNNSFEYWSKPDKAWLIYGSGQSMFWDSGNHGSATLSKNVTYADQTFKQSGNYAIKMESQFVGIASFGKFAAGNVFSGEYLGTDGTDGILSFGRPFESRPVKLRGYFKYNSGNVNYTSLSSVPSGVADTAFVYIALGDWTPQDYNGKKAPVLIKTKTKELFDPNHPNVIAYGSMQSGQSTEGEALIPFEINIDYRTFDRKPQYIIVVASASKYGDYFTGSTSSKLWLDDLELIYE